MSNLDSLKYPIGRYSPPKEISWDIRDQWIADLGAFPARLATLTQDLDTADLQASYRLEGWSIQQLVHHLADSHVHGFIRFKWALTEETPLIKAYAQAPWGALADSQGPIGPALHMLAGTHARWTSLLQVMDDTQWERQYRHPEGDVLTPLTRALGLYVWHGHHHYAHIEIALGLRQVD